MTKIVLLHGFAVGLSAPFIRPRFGASASMTAFEKQINERVTRVFPWGIESKVQPWELLNPFLLRKLYKDEKTLVYSDSLQTQLNAFLNEQQPSMIVCHSMGCLLLKIYLEHFKLPASVKSIVLIQSDLPASVSLSTTIPVHHLYCPWDPTLLLSSFINGHLRAGLCPSKYTNGNNFLFPLILPWNLHTSSVRDKKLITFIDSILETEMKR